MPQNVVYLEFAFFVYFEKIKYFSELIMKFWTMTVRFEFDRITSKLIVFRFMLILMSQRFKKSDSEAQNCCIKKHSQKRCKTVSISILQNSQREELTI